MRQAIIKTLATIGTLATFVVGVPFAFAAQTHHYTCTDFTLSGATCSGSAVTLAGDGQTAEADSSFTFTSGTTYYVSYSWTTNSTGSGANSLDTVASGVITDATAIPGYNSVTSGTVTDSPFTASGNADGILIKSRPLSSAHQVISNVCISDTAGACAGGGGGGGGSSIISSSTAVTLINGAVGDIGSFLSGSVPSILGIMVALLALGMGIRYVRKHISGRKF